MGLGLQFVSMPVGDQASLARYLEDYRFHVAVALAGGPERRLAERALASVPSSTSPPRRRPWLGSSSGATSPRWWPSPRRRRTSRL